MTAQSSQHHQSHHWAILIDRIMNGAVRTLRLATSATKATPQRDRGRKMLVFDLTHSARSILASGHQQIVTQRDLGGFFDEVYTLYPMLGAHPHDRGELFDGPRREVPISTGHRFIENKAMALGLPPFLAPLDFLATQAEMLRFACRTVESEGISVIRGGDPFVTGLYAYLVARATGRPYTLRIGSDFDALAALGVRSFPTLYPSYGLQRRVGAFVLRNADLVFVANETYGKYARRNGAPDDKTVLTRFGNLVDPLHFAAPEVRPGLPDDFPCPDRPFAIVVGRLTQVKYPGDAIRVAAKVREQIPGFALVMVGTGEMEEDLKRKCRSLGVQDSTFFVGLRNQEWLARTYPHALAYLAPHGGRSMVEAALASIPLVAHDFDWHSEIVTSRETGELVGFRDLDGLADALVRLWRDADYRAELGRKARARALEMMDQAAIEQIERDHYAALLESNGVRWAGTDAV